MKRMFLGSGRLPALLRAELDREGLRFLEEELSGSVRFRNLRGPGNFASSEMQAVAGVIAASRYRLVVCVSRVRGVDISVPIGRDHRIDGIDVLGGNGRVIFAYDLERFQSRARGHVEIHLKTPSADMIVNFFNPGRPLYPQAPMPI